ncbi:MAG: hypothetical protein II227_01040 [Clostridia bacterium]|nr:hypothetical protein [Clostridia bacterium]
MLQTETGDDPASIADEVLKKYNTNTLRFATGGLADFTGPAWLDGTKSRPEMVLNQRDTANLIMLKDVLSDILSGTNSIKNDKEVASGDNYFDININVESLEDDYGVDQMAEKIKNIIYEDATYRNVHAINSIS